MVAYTLEQRFASWAYDRLTEDADFGKKIIFLEEAHVRKQAKLLHLGHRKPAHIH